MAPKPLLSLLALPLLGCPSSTNSNDDDGSAASTGTSSGDATAGPMSTGGTEVDDGSASTSDGETGADSTGGSGSGTTDGTTGGSTGTGGEVCGPASVCVTDVPAGWQGPVAIRTLLAADDVPDCGGAYTDLQLDSAYGGLAGDDLLCGCECTPGSVACDGSAQVRLSEAQTGMTAPCPASDDSPLWMVNELVAASVPETYTDGQFPWGQNDTHGVRVTDVDVGPTGACTPTAANGPAPEAGFMDRTIACGTVDVAEDGCGDDGVCVPRPAPPYDGGVCIWRTGEEACPAAYPTQTVYHEDFEDGRDCSACECGSPSASCVDPTVGVTFYFDNAIGGGSGVTNPVVFDAPGGGCEVLQLCVGICVVITYSLEGITLDPGTLTFTDPDVPCPPSGGEPEGGLTPVDPVTICCTEPL